MVPYLRRFLREDPVTGFEPIELGPTSAYEAREEFLKRIAAGDEQCKWE
jgi:hypothetical protein